MVHVDRKGFIQNAKPFLFWKNIFLDIINSCLTILLFLLNNKAGKHLSQNPGACPKNARAPHVLRRARRGVTVISIMKILKWYFIFISKA